jgi:hypothetical protein
MRIKMMRYTPCMPVAARKEGRRTTIRVSPPIEKALGLWHVLNGPSSDQEALTTLVLRGADAIQRDYVLQQRMNSRWEAFHGQPGTTSNLENVATVTDEEWTGVVTAYRGGPTPAEG